MKKGDFLIIAIIVLLAVVAAVSFISVKGGERVVISKNNEIVFEAPLFEENTIDLGSNTVVITDGKVSVTKADCKNQICVKHKAVSKKGESIVCLPNKVIIEIK